MNWLEEVKWTPEGLIPAIAQDMESGRVLMVAWMNPEALERTVALKEAVYWSRSRKPLWHKGESSGHTQAIESIHLDCDGDVILLKVRQMGGIACHTGRESCFYQVLTETGWQTTDAVIKDPEDIYT